MNTEGDIYFKFKDAKKFCERENIGPYKMSEMDLNEEMLGTQIFRALRRKSEHEAHVLKRCQLQETEEE